jgi:predicted acylesterase/phospholipase RssA
MPKDAAPVTDGAKEANKKGVLANMSISVGARATSAAPTYLPGVFYQGLRFWDGGLLNNNPIDQLWRARYDLVGHKEAAPPISCVLSLGTSWSTAKSSSPFRFFNTVTTAVAFLTNTESKHMDFKRFINRITGRPGSGQNIKYFRFNTPTDKKAFNLDDYQKMPVLKARTQDWVKWPEVDEKIQECAESLIAS